MRVRWATLIPLLAALGCQDKKPDGSTATTEATTPAAVTPTATATATTAATPAAPPVEGAIAGHPFRPDTVTLDGNILSFRGRKDALPEESIQFQLPVPEGEKLEGREWTFGGKVEDHPALVIKPRDQKESVVLGPDYTMTLRFTRQARDTVQGTIELTVKNPAGTTLRGHFTAAYRKTPAAPLTADDSPYVHGKIVLKGAKKTENLAAGLVGRRDDGTPYSNEVGFPVEIAEPGFSFSEGLTAGQVSSLANGEAGLAYRHVRVPPGDYLVLVRRDQIMSAWKRVKLKAGDQQAIDLTIDPATAGEVVVTLPEGGPKGPAEGSLALVPLNADLPGLGLGSEHYFNVATVKAGDRRVTVGGVPAGKYRAVRGTDEAVVDVVAGTTTPVTLAPAKK